MVVRGATPWGTRLPDPPPDPPAASPRATRVEVHGEGAPKSSSPRPLARNTRTDGERQDVSSSAISPNQPGERLGRDGGVRGAIQRRHARTVSFRDAPPPSHATPAASTRSKSGTGWTRRAGACCWPKCARWPRSRGGMGRGGAGVSEPYQPFTTLAGCAAQGIFFEALCQACRRHGDSSARSLCECGHGERNLN